MPSKEVLSAAGHRYQARHDDRLGEPPSVDVERIVERKREHVADFAGHRRAAVHDLAEREGVTFRHEPARFTAAPENADPSADQRVLDVGGEELAVDYVVVATGSRVNVPELPGLDDVACWTSDDVLDATEFPDSGVVMGFGYVGIELVPYLAEVAGMELTVIEHDDRPLDRAAPAFGDALLECYREEFDVEVLTRTHERAVETTADGGVRLDVRRELAGAGGPDVGDPEDGSRTEAAEAEDTGVEDALDEELGTGGDVAADAATRLEGVTADALFAFTGREPNLQVGLEHTALDLREGWVADTLRSVDDPRVFVAGDATGEGMLLHTAKEEGYLAAENLRALVREARDAPDAPGSPVAPALERYDPIHHSVMFAAAGVYPYASVGMTAAEARDAGHDPIVAGREAADDGVFRVKDVPLGLARLVVARDGTVLGYHGLHHHADVMAKTMQVVVEGECRVDELPDRAFHPTTPEILDGLFRDASAEL